MTAGNSKEPRPDVAAIAGVTFRYYRGESDIAAMLAVHAGCREADRVDPFSVYYHVPNMGAEEYTRDVGLSLGEDSGRNVVLAEADGRVVGHSLLEWWNEWDSERQAERVAYLSRGWVLPEWRRRGIGTALLLTGVPQSAFHAGGGAARSTALYWLRHGAGWAA